MDRISVRSLKTSLRLVREPVVVTYSYPRNHPLYGAGQDCGVFTPMAVYEQWANALGLPFPPPHGIKLPDTEERDEAQSDIDRVIELSDEYERGYRDGIDEDIEK